MSKPQRAQSTQRKLHLHKILCDLGVLCGEKPASLFILKCWQKVEGYPPTQLACFVEHVEKKPKTGLFITIQIVFYRP
jgi:hypothetical protein